MQETKEAEANYARGFNEGYLITEFLPELSEKLARMEINDPRLRGFKDGRTEYLQEKDKSRDLEKGPSPTLNNEPPPSWRKSPTVSRFLLPKKPAPDKSDGKPQTPKPPRRDKGPGPGR